MAGGDTQADLFTAGGEALPPAGSRPARSPREPRTARSTASPAEPPERRRLRERLSYAALRIGLLFGAEGFMLSDVRHEAIGSGILTGEEGAPHPGTGRLMKPRELAWLGTLLPGLERDGLVEKVVLGGRVQFGQSAGERAHGNKQVLWRLTDRGRRAAGAVVDGHEPTNYAALLAAAIAEESSRAGH